MKQAARQSEASGMGDAELPDASLPDEVFFEEGSGEDDGAAGLELDPRQATEIRQIFLTTLPDYLEPIRQMVEQLTASPNEDGELRVTLTKTLSSMAEAARRVGISDVQRTLELLREDVLLFGDPAEAQDALVERIKVALGSLSRLAQSASGTSAGAQRAESIVAALRNIEGIGPHVLEKLLAAGLVSVEQILSAGAGEVAAVSGLDAATVEQLVTALRTAQPRAAKRSSLPLPSMKASERPAPAPRPDEIDAVLANQVDSELSLEETRGRLLRLRLRLRELRDQRQTAELRRDELRHSLGQTKQRIVERFAILARIEAKREGIERDGSMLRTKLEQLASRLAALEAERHDAVEEDVRLARDVSSLARRVDGVLRNLTTAAGDASAAPPARK